MTPSVLAGLTGAALVGFGLYGLILHPHPLRKLLAFNLMGSGVFLIFGIVAIIYFLLCWPLTLASGWLERRLATAYRR